MRNPPPQARTIKIGICLERFYLVAVQRYVGKRQSNVVDIDSDPNLGAHLCCNYWLPTKLTHHVDMLT
jgi:hypothetical protein